MGASDRYAYSQLNQDHRFWLRALPGSANTDYGILACQGTLTDDNQYLIEETLKGPTRAGKPCCDPESTGLTEARVVVCGILTLPAGQCVPWHSDITDSFASWFRSIANLSTRGIAEPHQSQVCALIYSFNPKPNVAARERWCRSTPVVSLPSHDVFSGIPV
jgi:hypothetical protein